jgi:uncharacterized protein
MAIIDIRAQIGTSTVLGAQTSGPDLVRVLTKYGISGCVVSSTLANSCDFKTGNARLAEEIKKQARFLGCLVVNTSHPEESTEEMHEYLGAKNFAGVILRSGVAGRHVMLDECADILNSFRRFTTKVVFLEAKSRDAVAATREIAERFPTIKFVMMSMGGDDWPNAAAAAAKTLNIYLETSGNLNPNKIKYTYEAVGPNRLLFGSNWPYANPALSIGLIEDADISDADKKRIFETNGMRILGYGKASD